MRVFLFLFTVCIAISAAFSNAICDDVVSDKVHLVVFGDSWSDNGNACKATDDKVWNEYMMEMDPSYVVHNYARCGAKTRDLKAQVNAFLKDSKIRSDDTVVYVVWISGNDYIQLAEELQNIALNAEDSFSLGLKVVKAVVSLHIEAPKRIFEDVDRLLNDGPGKKKYVFVGNMPNFSIFPAGSPVQAFTKISTGSIDKLVGNMLDSLSATHCVRISRFVDPYQPERGVRLLNFYRYFNNITSKTEMEFVCSSQELCESVLFHDLIHFNHNGHRLIAEYVYKRVSEALNGTEDLSDREEHTVQEDVLCKEAEDVFRSMDDIYKEYVPESVRDKIKEGVEDLKTEVEKGFEEMQDAYREFAPKVEEEAKKKFEKMKEFFKEHSPDAQKGREKIKDGLGKTLEFFGL